MKDVWRAIKGRGKVRASIAIASFCIAISPWLISSLGPETLREVTTNKAMAAADETMDTTEIISPKTLDTREGLLSLNTDEIDALFAEPDLERHDGAVLMRQYRADGCILDLYMKKTSGGGMSVIHSELRGTATAAFLPRHKRQEREPEPDEQACMKTLVSARN